MGQAAVLPDPLDESASTVASADDLLSQLAGEEIDRLLAESHSEAAPEPLPQDAPRLPAPAADSAAVDLRALAREATEEAAAHPPTVSSSPTTPASEPVEPSKTEAVATPAVSVAADHPIEAINTEERAALRDQSDEVHLAALPQEREDRLPLYLKPLEWLNAPLAVFPDAVREALGRVAIVTLVNAIAVLLYVVLFRKH